MLITNSITINGIAVKLIDDGTEDMGPDLSYGMELVDYFEKCIINGPRSFIMAVNSTDEFKMVIRRKIVLEIASIEYKPEYTIRFVSQKSDEAPVPKVCKIVSYSPADIDDITGHHPPARDSEPSSQPEDAAPSVPSAPPASPMPVPTEPVNPVLKFINPGEGEGT